MHRQPPHKLEEVGFQLRKRSFQEFALEVFKQARVQHDVAGPAQIWNLRKQISKRVGPQSGNKGFEGAWVSTQTVDNSPTLLSRHFVTQPLGFQKLCKQCLSF